MDIFDSFSWTTIINLEKQAKSKINKKYKKEVYGSEVMDYAANTYGTEDIYPSECVIEDNHGHSCVITKDWLYQAMYNLDEQEKAVLIFEFWYGMSMNEISIEMGVTKRTVYNKKKKAFSYIKDFYERNNVK